MLPSIFWSPRLGQANIGVKFMSANHRTRETGNQLHEICLMLGSCFPKQTAQVGFYGAAADAKSFGNFRASTQLYER
jgi:hypothetical protein